MYTCDGLKKYREQMAKAIGYYDGIPAENLEICISTGNRKIGKVWNISLPAMFTCGNCAECIKWCYDVKACLQYKNVTMARAKNYSILKRDFAGYWNRLRRRMARKRTNKYFRFHVSGDITSSEYLDEMVKTARMFPEWIIWTYTKEYDLVNEYVRKHGGSRSVAIPKNLTIMFSEWRGLKMPNPYDFPVFRCVFRKIESAPKTGWHCPGNCDICKREHRGCVAGESSWVWDH